MCEEGGCSALLVSDKIPDRREVSEKGGGRDRGDRGREKKGREGKRESEGRREREIKCCTMSAL